MSTEPTPQLTGGAQPQGVNTPDAAAPSAAEGRGVQRISRLRHPGVLRDFSWPASLTPFKRFNLVYGWNGTGKTTVSEVFRALEERATPSPTQVTLRVDGRDLRGEEFPGATFPVRVFNREYVRQSVFPEGGGDMPLILILGKENVEKQKQVTELRAKATQLDKDLDSSKEEARKAERALDEFCVARALVVKDALRAAGSAYNNYDKRTFKQRAQTMHVAGDAKSHVLADPDREKLIAQHRGTPKDALVLLEYKFPDWTALAKDVTAAVGRSAASNAIASLKTDPTLSRWTQDGLKLHQERGAEKCLFCEQPLPEHRLEDLAAHFSAAYRDLETRVTGLAATVATHVRALDDLLMPKRAELHDDLAGDFEAAVDQLEPHLKAFRVGLNLLASTLEEKRKSPFEALSPALGDPGADASALAAVNEVIQRHNDACSAFETRAVEARKKLEADSVAGGQADYTSKLADKTSKDSAVATKSAEIETVSAEIAEAEREIVQHRRPAEELNADLQSYLGHSELQLTISDKGYVVARAGIPAQGLSEGEQTAIALLYFLKSLQDRRFAIGEGLVVLDDPVSSLDANALFLAFGFIRSRLQHAGQLIVLTHNFSFFRQVRQWFHHLPKGQRKTAAFYMLEAKASGAGRTAALCPLDPLLERYESEYHYLFARVLREAQGLGPSGLEAKYVLPNVARRLLEGFLAFRQPRKVGLEPKVMGMAGEEAKKLRVVRFLHAHSHGEALTEPEHDPSQLSEAPSVLRDMLELIKAEDCKHYEAMVALCSAEPIEAIAE